MCWPFPSSCCGRRGWCAPSSSAARHEPVLLLAMLLWANLHGGFTLGLLLAGAFALEAVVGARDADERRALFVAWAKFGVAALLVACITPYGPESILVTLRIFGLGEALGTIAEWRSPDFHKQPLQEIVLLLAVYLALSRGLKLPLIRLLIVIGLLHLFLRYARNAELLATLVPLMIAPLLVRQFPVLGADPQARGRLNALAGPAGPWALTLCLGLVGLSAGVVIGLGSIAPPSTHVPAGALAFARDAGLKGRVLNHYNYGGFLIGAGVPTYIDGRGELYGGDFIKRYAEAVNLRGEEPFESLLERERIDWTLLPRDQPANQLLMRLPGWRRAYGDDTATIFVRHLDLQQNPGAGADGAEAAGFGVEGGARIELAAFLADLPADHGAALAHLGRLDHLGRHAAGHGRPEVVEVLGGEGAGTIERAPHELRPDAALAVGMIGVREIAGERGARLRSRRAEHAQAIADRALAATHHAPGEVAVLR